MKKAGCFILIFSIISFVGFVVCAGIDSAMTEDPPEPRVVLEVPFESNSSVKTEPVDVDTEHNVQVGYRLKIWSDSLERDNDDDYDLKYWFPSEFTVHNTDGETIQREVENLTHDLSLTTKVPAGSRMNRSARRAEPQPSNIDWRTFPFHHPVESR